VYTYNREPFKHFKRATEKTVISCVRVGVIVNPKLCRKKIKIPYTVKCQETSVKALLRHSHGYWTAGCCQQPCIRILARHPRAVAPLLNWAAAVKNYFERAPDDCIIWPYVSMLEKWTPKRNNLMFPYVMNISCEKYMYMLVQIVIKTKINFEHLLFFLLRTISWFHVCATRCLM